MPAPRKEAQAEPLALADREAIAERVARWLVRRGEPTVDGCELAQTFRIVATSKGSQYLPARRLRGEVLTLLVARGLLREERRRTARRGRQRASLWHADLTRLTAWLERRAA